MTVHPLFTKIRHALYPIKTSPGRIPLQSMKIHPMIRQIILHKHTVFISSPSFGIGGGAIIEPSGFITVIDPFDSCPKDNQISISCKIQLILRNQTVHIQFAIDQLHKVPKFLFGMDKTIGVGVKSRMLHRESITSLIRNIVPAKEYRNTNNKKDNQTNPDYPIPVSHLCTSLTDYRDRNSGS